MSKAPAAPKAPAFQFYASDFVAEVAELDSEEVAIYVLLKCKDWMETGFVFDEARLARFCRVSPARFRAAWEHLAAHFPMRDGRHYNPRLEAEREKQAAYRAVQSAKGIASGESRRRNRGGTDAAPKLNPGSNSGSTGVEPEGNSPFPSPASATAVALTRGHSASHGHGNRRSGAGDLVPIRPHLPAVDVAPPWCAECGPGDRVAVPGQQRLVQVHLATCSRYVAPAGTAGVEVPA